MKDYEEDYKWLSKAIKDTIHTYTLTNDYYSSL